MEEVVGSIPTRSTKFRSPILLLIITPVPEDPKVAKRVLTGSEPVSGCRFFPVYYSHLTLGRRAHGYAT